MNVDQLYRLEKINELIEVIADIDRCFFKSSKGVGKFVPLKTTVQWYDGYTQKTMPIIEGKRMRYFSQGGTLQELVRSFKLYIMSGKSYVYGGLYATYWGYSIDGHDKIIKFAKEIGYLENHKFTYRDYLKDLSRSDGRYMLSEAAIEELEGC